MHASCCTCSAPTAFPVDPLREPPSTRSHSLARTVKKNSTQNTWGGYHQKIPRGGMCPGYVPKGRAGVSWRFRSTARMWMGWSLRRAHRSDKSPASGHRRSQQAPGLLQVYSRSTPGLLIGVLVAALLTLVVSIVNGFIADMLRNPDAIIVVVNCFIPNIRSKSAALCPVAKEQSRNYPRS